MAMFGGSVRVVWGPQGDVWHVQGQLEQRPEIVSLNTGAGRTAAIEIAEGQARSRGSAQRSERDISCWPVHYCIETALANHTHQPIASHVRQHSVRGRIKVEVQIECGSWSARGKKCGAPWKPS